MSTIHFNKNYLLSFLCLLASLLGCKKYLDKKSNSILVTPSKLEDYQKLLDDADIMNLSSTPSYGESSADDYFLPDTKYNALAQTARDIYLWKRTPYDQADWKTCYTPIYNANLCLDGLKSLEKNTGNQTDWNNIEGSAYFYRSYYFLMLLWNYAKTYDSVNSKNDLGIVLRLTSDFNIKSERSSVFTCYTQLLEDIQNAINLLPNQTTNIYRPSKAAAYALKARAYLSMREYDSALIYADKCLEIKNQLMDFNGDEDINGTLSAAIPFKPQNKEILFISEMGTSLLLFSSSRALTDTTIISNYREGDLRKNALHILNGNYFRFKGSYMGQSGTHFFSGLATDEIYLIKAESEARTGMWEQGIETLKILLKKRMTASAFAAISVTNESSALDVILMERRKELLMRGLRWMDIKRLNAENRQIIPKRIINGTSYTLRPNDSLYALPLPNDLILITGMEQN